MGYIYKITNKVNGKIYIGQTRVSEPQRWQGHVWHAYNNPSNDCIYLCNAIKKYGKNNFNREIIEEINDNLLNEREKYWISYYNSTDKNIGYNLALGGKGYGKFSTEKILETYNETKSITQTAKILKCSKDTISRHLNGLNINTTHEISIKQYDLYGNFIKHYNKISDASEEVGFKITPNNRYVFGNYIFIRDDEDIKIEEVIKKITFNSKIKQQVEQYDLNCNLVAIFPSAAAAARETGLSLNSIKSNLQLKQNVGCGYIWHRTYGDITLKQRYEKYLLSSSCCQIEEIDLNGNILNEYQSATKLEKELNWQYNSIKQVCDGEKLSVNGRYFRYKHPDKRLLLFNKEEFNKVYESDKYGFNMKACG